MPNPILEIENVDMFFGDFQALKNVNLSIEQGECMAIVGESGSGKTTLGNIILGVLEASAGTVKFKGDILPAKRPLSLKRNIQVVQQNPLSSLNPKRSVFQNVALPLQVHTDKTVDEQREIVAELLELMQLPREFMDRYPPNLSGGQRQRAAIARALACKPDIIVLDEPTSALDVLVQIDVLKLLADIQEKFNLTYIFITHDLGVVRNFSDRVAVFKDGNMLEQGTVKKIFEKGPDSEYTAYLLSAVPTMNDKEEAIKQKLTKAIAQ